VSGMYRKLFLQMARFEFERQLYDMIDSEGALYPQLVGEIWHKTLNRMYDGAVQVHEYQRMGWALPPHLFFPRRRFYNFPYTMAYLTAAGIVETLGNGGQDLIRDILGVGRTTSFRDAIENGMGLSLREILGAGVTVLEHQVTQFEQISRDMNSI